MTTQSISININLDGLRGELQRSLQDVICLVSTGLSANSNIDPNNLSLPTAIKHSFSSINMNESEFDEYYRQWIISNGFRDAIESISTFLESANRVLSIWGLVKKQNSGESVTAEEWKHIFQDAGNKFHRLGLPDKIKHINEQHQISVTEALSEQVLSLNIARNCYVHRKGIVSDRDANSDAELKVMWTHMHMFLMNEDGEQELIFGVPLEKESTVHVKRQQKEKTFPIGTRLNFSVNEVSEMLWCFFLFGNELVMNISKFGELHGFVQPADAQQG